ncbi:MAG: hypothetical protein IAI49_01360, partial [Candidatus Eremiobacteraeota bacterium]|nr:hypothetical protein [Candidatus Eremiobacteraeota bacterium]
MIAYVALATLIVALAGSPDALAIVDESGAAVSGAVVDFTDAAGRHDLETSDSTGLQGLPSAVFTLPAGNPFSPFANTVTVDRG